MTFFFSVMQTYLSAISSSTPPQKKTSSGQPLFKFNKLTNIYFQHTYTDIRPIQLNKYRTKLQQIECNRPTFVTDDQQLGLYIHVLLMCNKSQSTQHITSQANVSLFESKAKEKSTITHHSLFFRTNFENFKVRCNKLVYLRYKDLAFQVRFHS